MPDLRPSAPLRPRRASALLIILGDRPGNRDHRLWRRLPRGGRRRLAPGVRGDPHLQRGPPPGAAAGHLRGGVGAPRAPRARRGGGGGGLLRQERAYRGGPRARARGDPRRRLAPPARRGGVPALGGQERGRGDRPGHQGAGPVHGAAAAAPPGAAASRRRRRRGGGRPLPLLPRARPRLPAGRCDSLPRCSARAEAAVDRPHPGHARRPGSWTPWR